MPKNETSSKYHSKSQQRILKIIFILAGHEIDGLSNGEISKAIKVEPCKVTRDLGNLRIAGLAEKLFETERWRLTPKLSQIGLAMLEGIDKSQRKTDEVKQRYTRKP